MVPLQDLIFPLVSFLLFIVFLHKRRSSATAPTPRKRPPPSPRKLPIIGNLHQLGTHSHRSLQSLSKQYGHVMLLHLGNVPVVVASSAEAAREIMKNQDLIFSNRPKITIPDRLTYGSRDIAFAPYGEYWRQARSVCVLQLLSNRRVQSFRHVREEETSIMVEKIRKMGSLVNLSEVLGTLTNNVICRVALGRKYSDEGEGKKFRNIVKEYEELLGTWRLGDYVPWLARMGRDLDLRVERVAREFNEFLESVVEEHRERRKSGEPFGGVNGGNMDFVDILLEFQRGNKDGSSPLEDETIKVLIQDMFAAGTGTTSTVLGWTMAELIRNPRTMIALQNEVSEVLAGRKEEITEDDVEKMHYLKAVIKESLRLHTPAPLLVPREVTEDTTLMGYDIAAGTQIMINAWAIARDPLLWRNPEEFHPERFLDSSIDFRGLHFEFIPFGAGRRGCPGITFGVAVNEIVLAKLVHNFEFALPDGARVEELDMSEGTGITVYRKRPLLVVATSRTSY